MKTSDVPAQQVLDLVLACNEGRCEGDAENGSWHGGALGYGYNPEESPEPHWTYTIYLAQRLNVPVKVMQAKLRRMKGRGELMGCACGCRGDWIVPGSPIDPVSWLPL